jgi:glycosyltransferase involved in cell wall biosynthesis
MSIGRGGPLAAPVAGARSGDPPLRIVHCFRAPVGGVFRHVRDLVEAQHGAGHAVGLICDSSTGGAFEQGLLDSIRPFLTLGLRRFPMRRNIAPSDIAATLRMMREVRSLHPDILHAHGAKGGAYARIIGTLLRASGVRVARIYSPHGGSLHYDAKSRSGRAYFAAERLMERMTDAFVFVSQFEADTYAAKVGKPRKPATVVRNGLRPEEFEPVPPGTEARDFLFIGELRDLKGPDVFIAALARLGGATAFVVGAGDGKPRYEAMVKELGLGGTVTFRDRMPARQAFALARTIVVPSRAESMPYIVLEAIAAGMPIVATRVGGIPEIFGASSGRLVAPGDSDALAAAMAEMRAAPGVARAQAARLRDEVRPQFSVEAMAAAILRVYRQVLAPVA